MGRSLKIFTLFGIPVFLHWTFPLMFIWIAYLPFTNADGGVTLFLWLSCLFLLIFLCVVLHEYGHALTARKYGVQTKDIILSPIGGMARLEKLPEHPWHEFQVAIAGPLVNVGIFILLFVFSYTFGYFESWAEGIQQESSLGMLMRGGFFEFILGSLLITNLVLVLFNLIPAFPMDGGRILRSLLSIPFGRTKSTLYATRLAQVLAVAGLVYAFSSNQVMLGLICLFVLLTSSQEYRMVKLESIMKDTLVKQMAQMQYSRIYKSDPLEIAIDKLNTGAELNFLVFENEDNNQICGILSQTKLEEAIRKKDYNGVSVGDKMSSHFESVPSSMNLQELYMLMQSKKFTILPVQLDNGEIAKIDMQQLNEFLRIQQRINK